MEATAKAGRTRAPGPDHGKETMRTQRRERENATNTTGRARIRTSLRRLWPAPLGGMAVISAMLLLTPLAGAAHIASFSAPYTGGVAVHYKDPVSQGCGAQLTVSSPAAFALSTGLGTGRAAAKSTPCATSDSQATYDGIVGVRGLAFTAAASGATTVTAHWNITWNATATMTATAAAAGAQSTVEIWLLVKLYDSSTKSWTVGKTFFVVQQDLASAAKYANGAVGGIYTATLHQSLTSGHSYAVYAVMGFDLAAVVPQGSPAGSAVTAGIDLGSASHGGSLTSIVIG